VTRSEEGLSKTDFNRLRALIYQEAGIVLNAEKQTMLEIRVKRRVRSLGSASYREYCDFVFSPEGREAELTDLIDAVTTNKTDFFRESHHFEWLTSHALPDLDARLGSHRRSLVWSAGCSTGEEPYTLAMVLNEYALRHPGFDFGVLATDISTDVLERAQRAVFKQEAVAPVPTDLRRKYFMRSRAPGSGTLRVVPELREQIEFRRMNFMDADLRIDPRPEIIFCRNVIIYFDRATQERTLQKLVANLAPGGYFFAGHSESLQGMKLPLEPAGLAVYRKIAK
jgi:chemotaxis protein methyltransferase CheR